MRNKVELIFCKGNWYHPNFFVRRKTCLKRANYTCQHCGRKQGDPCNEVGQDRNHAYLMDLWGMKQDYPRASNKDSKIVLQAHHPNNDRTNPRAVLVALCKSCHMIADGPEHDTKARRTYYRKEREAQIATGQLAGKWLEGRKRKTA
jgi:hypothetical protein